MSLSILPIDRLDLDTHRGLTGIQLFLASEIIEKEARASQHQSLSQNKFQPV